MEPMRSIQLPQDEREAFEAWYERTFGARAFARNVDHSYQEPETEMLWAGWQARAARPAQTEQPPIAVQVCKLGIYGKAYDAPETKRAYTYAEQPDNVGAMKLGRAVRAASSASAGDEIDRGLALLHALAAEGFGVFAVGAEYSAEGDIGG